MITFLLEPKYYSYQPTKNGMSFENAVECLRMAANCHHYGVRHDFINNKLKTLMNQDDAYDGIWITMSDDQFGRFITYRSLIGDCINNVSGMKVIHHKMYSDVVTKLEETKSVEISNQLDINLNDVVEILEYLNIKDKPRKVKKLKPTWAFYDIANEMCEIDNPSAMKNLCYLEK